MHEKHASHMQVMLVVVRSQEMVTGLGTASSRCLYEPCNGR